MSDLNYVPGVSRRINCFINARTKAFCLILSISIFLNGILVNLNFETKTAEIWQVQSEVHYFKKLIRVRSVVFSMTSPQSFQLRSPGMIVARSQMDLLLAVA